jgi:hypothetical protein
VGIGESEGLLDEDDFVSWEEEVMEVDSELEAAVLDPTSATDIEDEALPDVVGTAEEVTSMAEAILVTVVVMVVIELVVIVTVVVVASVELSVESDTASTLGDETSGL